MGKNILKNPALTGFSKPPEVFYDPVSKEPGYVDWRFVYSNIDPSGRIPQSLHVDGAGFKIAAGWRKWVAGYEQEVHLRADQRYLCKAVFTVEPQPKTVLIEWRFLVQMSNYADAVVSAWSSDKTRYGQEMTHLFVIQPRISMTVTLAFMARSEYPDNACDFNVHAIMLEEVGQDYGTPTYLGERLETPVPAPTPTPVPVPTPTPTPVPIPTPPPGFIVVPSGLVGKLREIAKLYEEMADMLEEGPGVG